MGYILFKFCLSNVSLSIKTFKDMWLHLVKLQKYLKWLMHAAINVIPSKMLL